LRFTQFAIEKTIDQAFWMTKDARLFYVNEAACRTLGYTREELTKMSIPDIGPTFSPEMFAEHWRDLQENGSTTLETYSRAKDGRVYPVAIRANYVVFDGKEYNCAFATDISERKRAEEELRRAHDDLEKRSRSGHLPYVTQTSCCSTKSTSASRRRMPSGSRSSPRSLRTPPSLCCFLMEKEWSAGRMDGISSRGKKSTHRSCTNSKKGKYSLSSLKFGD
jgi:PAS domain S-box-containing protein